MIRRDEILLPMYRPQRMCDCPKPRPVRTSYGHPDYWFCAHCHYPTAKPARNFPPPKKGKPRGRYAKKGA